MSGQGTGKSKGVTRRQVIAGTGAALASAGLITLDSKNAEASWSWDYETDILVVGTGVGALTAAITAHGNGDAVRVVEKANFIGGTSAKSAGVLWIPNNFTLRARGIVDSKRDCVRYQARFSYPERYNPEDGRLGLSTHEFSLLEAFYDNASAAIDSLRNNNSLKVAEWRMFFLDHPATDYLDHVAENKVPAGRALGPLKDDGSMGAGGDLMSQLSKAVATRKIPVLMTHRATSLVQNSDARVIGIQAVTNGKTVSLKARKAVIFATGGYVHNREMTNRYQPARLYGSCAMPAAEGDFINIGVPRSCSKMP